jgi:hypothetical protein
VRKRLSFAGYRLRAAPPNRESFDPEAHEFKDRSCPIRRWSLIACQTLPRITKSGC